MKEIIFSLIIIPLALHTHGFSITETNSPYGAEYKGSKGNSQGTKALDTFIVSHSHKSSMNTANTAVDGKCKMLLNADQADPEWKVDEKTAKELLDYCEKAKPYEKSFEIPEPHGYSGVVFYSGNNSYKAFKGKIDCVVGGKQIEKADIGRQFEQMVLKTVSPEFKKVAYNQLTVDFD